MAGQDQPEAEAAGNQNDSRRKLREKRMTRRTTKESDGESKRKTIDRRISKSFGPTGSRANSDSMSNRRRALQAAGSRKASAEGSRRGPRSRSEEELEELHGSMRLEGAEAAYTRTAARGVTRTKSLSRSRSTVDQASLSVANKLMLMQSASTKKETEEDLNKSWVLDPMSKAEEKVPDKKFNPNMSLKW